MAQVAVSYTHLDVYKRQEITCKGAEYAVYYQNDPGAEAVSYTHLDVYKRQGRHQGYPRGSGEGMRSFNQGVQGEHAGRASLGNCKKRHVSGLSLIHI